MLLPSKLKATFANGNPLHPAPDYFPLHALLIHAGLNRLDAE